MCQQCVHNKRIKMLKSALKIFVIGVPSFIAFSYITSAIMAISPWFREGLVGLIVMMIWVGALVTLFVSIVEQNIPRHKTHFGERTAPQ